MVRANVRLGSKQTLCPVFYDFLCVEGPASTYLPARAWRRRLQGFASPLSAPPPLGRKGVAAIGCDPAFENNRMTSLPTATRASAIIAPFAAALLLSAKSAAVEPIDTDGPDFVESSEVVPVGHFQYEVDFTSTQTRQSLPNTPSFSTPTLLKYGFAQNFELRIAPEGYLRQNGTSGLGDTAIGLKWHAQDRDAKNGIPAVSWILHFDMPTGSRDFRGSGTRPSLRSVITWDLPHDFALGIMPGIKSDTRDDRHRFTSAIFGVVLNERFTERFRGFVEASAPQITSRSNGGTIGDRDVGAAYLVNNDLQLGVRTGVAANINTPSKYFLFEIGQRF